MPERAPHALSPVARRFPPRLLQEATQSLEPRLIDAFLDPTQWGQSLVLGVRPPAFVALLGLEEGTSLACPIAPDGVPVDQEGARQAQLGPAWAFEQSVELCLLVDGEV